MTIAVKKHHPHNNKMKEAAQYIINIFRIDPVVVLSWGINNVVTRKNGLEFKVQGFKFQGCVSINFNEGTELFDISFQNEKGVEKIDGVYGDRLVDVIDRHVEYTGVNYAKDIDNWLLA